MLPNPAANPAADWSEVLANRGEAIPLPAASRQPPVASPCFSTVDRLRDPAKTNDVLAKREDASGSSSLADYLRAVRPHKARRSQGGRPGTHGMLGCHGDATRVFNYWIHR